MPHLRAAHRSVLPPRRERALRHHAVVDALLPHLGSTVTMHR